MGNPYIGVGLNTAQDFQGLTSNNPYQKQASQSQMIGGLIGAGAGSFFGPAGMAIGNNLGRLVGGAIGQKKAGRMQEEGLARDRARAEMFRSFYS